MNKLSNKIKSACLIAGLLSGIAQVSHAARVSEQSAKDVLVVTETVDSAGGISIAGRLGPLVNAERPDAVDRGFGIHGPGFAVGGAASLTPLPGVVLLPTYPTVTGLPTKGDVQAAANAAIAANGSFARNAMATYLTRYGASSGWFNFKQEVQVDVNDAAETWTIYWDFFTDPKGRGSFGDAQIVPPDPKTLYMIYTSSNADGALPAGYAFGGGGTVKWQLRNSLQQPVTPFVTIDVHGAFDTAQTGTEIKDEGVKCLMNSNTPGCTPVYGDALSLMNKTGAVIVIADYVRRISPVYVDQGGGVSVPLMSTTVDLREVSYATCTDMSFHNKGTVGYTLEQSIGRYFGRPTASLAAGQYALVAEFSARTLSPTANYEFFKPITRADVVSLADLAIDPIQGAAVPLLTRADIPGLISFAPLSPTGDPHPSYGTFTSGQYHTGGADDNYRVDYTARCGDTGVEVITHFDRAYHSDPWEQLAKGPIVVADNSWTPIPLALHGDQRYAAMTDTAAGIVWITDNVTALCYPDTGYWCGNSADYPHHHNFNSLIAEDDAWAGYNPSMQACTASGYFHLDGGALTNQTTCSGYHKFRGFYLNGAGPVLEFLANGTADPLLDTYNYTCTFGQDPYATTATGAPDENWCTTNPVIPPPSGVPGA